MMQKEGECGGRQGGRNRLEDMCRGMDEGIP
jgi:hypothetical protein